MTRGLWVLAIAVCTASAIIFGIIGGFIGFQLAQRTPQVIVQLPPLK